jgi:UPF0716 protein FxsA
MSIVRYYIAMFLILLLQFTVIPALEIFLFIEIGGRIGSINTFMIVIVTGIIGASLAKSQGIQIIQKIQSELNRGALPADQFIHGLLVFGGGLLLLTPGFLTDFLGLSMVFPVTRFFMIGFAKGIIEKGMKNGNINVFTTTGRPTGNPHDFGQQVYDSPPEEKVESVDNIIEADFSRKE